jgi:hypothetical protein
MTQRNIFDPPEVPFAQHDVFEGIQSEKQFEIPGPALVSGRDEST